MSEPIVAFLRLESPDSNGRMISDIWRYSDEELESSHDYIQWLFPLFERSEYSSSAPMLTIDSAEEIVADEICRSSLNHSLSQMRSFYDGNLHWAKQNDHNLLRITRILKSLAILLGKASSIEFHNFILRRCDKLRFKPSDVTLDYWRKATTAELAQYYLSENK